MKRRLLTVLLLALTFVAPTGLVADDGGLVSKLELTSSSAQEFDRQREEYFNALEFCTGYVLRQATMKSEKEAREKPLEGANELYVGFLEKSGVKYRLTEEYPQTGSNATGVSYDMVGDDKCIAVFYPKRGGKDSSTGALTPRVGDEPAINSASASLSPIGLVFKSFNSSPQDGGEPIATPPVVSALDGERVKITYRDTHPVRGEFTKTIIVRVLTKQKSLVEEITFRFVDENGRPTAVFTQLVTEWTDARGVQIPARVRTFVNFAAKGRKTAWLVSEWDGGELAKRRPNADDFIIDIKTGREPKVKVHNPEEGVVDLNAVSPEDWRGGAILFMNGLRVSQ